MAATKPSRLSAQSTPNARNMGVTANGKAAPIICRVRLDAAFAEDA